MFPRTWGLVLLTCVLCAPGVAAQPVQFPGTQWNTAGKLQVKVAGEKVRGLGEGRLEFGPRALLAANALHLRLGNLDVFGTYAIDSRGKLSCTTDVQAFTAELNAVYDPMVPGGVDVYVHSLQLKVKARSSRRLGEQVKITLQTKFTLTLRMTGEHGKAKMSYRGIGGSGDDLGGTPAEGWGTLERIVPASWRGCQPYEEDPPEPPPGDDPEDIARATRPESLRSHPRDP